LFYAPLSALSRTRLKLCVVLMMICAYKSRQILASRTRDCDFDATGYFNCSGTYFCVGYCAK